MPKPNDSIFTWFNSATTGYIHKGDEMFIPQKVLLPSIFHSRTIHINQNMDLVQLSFSGCMDKENVA